MAANDTAHLGADAAEGAGHEGAAALPLRGIPLLLVDSITEAPSHPPGQVVISGSHAGVSVVGYTQQAQPRLAVFNDAGIGKDDAGVAALPALQALGLAACTVGHDSARIGQARSTLADGVITRCNDGARALGAAPGLRLRDWLISAGAVES
jgi:hypothetical protein